MFIVVLTLNQCIYLSVGFPTPTYSRASISSFYVCYYFYDIGDMRSLCDKVEQVIKGAVDIM
jgi:hypothetical protein